MKRLHYTIDIEAPRDKVWATMFADASYRIWSAAFAEGSHFVGSWDEGSEIIFLESSGEQGMVSQVRESRPPEYLELSHRGIVKNGAKDFDSEEVRKWAPSTESYRLAETPSGTRLDVEMDSPEDYVEYFDKAWPDALQRLKSLAEA